MKVSKLDDKKRIPVVLFSQMTIISRFCFPCLCLAIQFDLILHSSHRTNCSSSFRVFEPFSRLARENVQNKVLGGKMYRSFSLHFRTFQGVPHFVIWFLADSFRCIQVRCECIARFNTRLFYKETKIPEMACNKKIRNFKFNLVRID